MLIVHQVYYVASVPVPNAAFGPAPETKEPKASDTFCFQALAAPFAVNTMPEATLGKRQSKTLNCALPGRCVTALLLLKRPDGYLYPGTVGLSSLWCKSGYVSTENPDI